MTHHFSTIHAPRVRKCTASDRTFRDEREADDSGSYHFAARRSCLPSSFTAPAPPFVPTEALARRQAKCGASESRSPPLPLWVIQAQAQAQGLLLLASVPSPGPGHQHVMPEPSLLVVDHQSLIAEPKPPSASASASSGANASANARARASPGANASANTSASASTGANASANANAGASPGASASASANLVNLSGASASPSGVNARVIGASCASATSHDTRVPTPSRPESPLAHARRGASPNRVPPARLETFPTGTGFRLSIALPRPGGASLASEMITVSARRGGRLAVVADAWHLEHDCEYTLPPFFRFCSLLSQLGFFLLADRR